MKFKICIVDDEQDVVQLASKRLRSFGGDVVCFYEGEGVIPALYDIKPDILLLDIWLPDISGVELFKQLKADAELKHIPVIFFSANCSKEEYCLNVLGAEGFIEKPYNPARLWEVIEGILEKQEKKGELV